MRLQELYNHTKILASLENLISSGLESKHKNITTSSIRMWNSVFGSCSDSLEYPDRVKSALLRLHPVADLQLPFFPASRESESSVDQRQVIEFEDTQNDSTEFPISSALDSAFQTAMEPVFESPITRKLRQSKPAVIIESKSSTSRKRSREVTPDSGRRKSSKQEVTPRLRHDDSQIQFEAIESSPMASRVVDSQLLTENQKEAKERQQAEAAMFPDLRSSSPRFVNNYKHKTTPDPDLPTHLSSAKIRSKIAEPADRQTTPTLGLPSDDDQFLTSSPTPTRHLQQDIGVSDPPSSPPEATERKDMIHDTEFPSSPPETTPELANNAGIVPHQQLLDGYAGDTTLPPLTNLPHFHNLTLLSEATPAGELAIPGVDNISHISNSGDITVEHANDTISSLDPSAQYDPYAWKNTISFSTSGSIAAQQQDTHMSENPAAQLEYEMNQYVASSVKDGSIDGGIEEKKQSMRETSKQQLTLDAPRLGTPEMSKITSPLSQKTPRFVDAYTSPTPSDKHTDNEDMFEDALSSPRIDIEIAQQENRSSDLSSFDESSMLRVVCAYDEPVNNLNKDIAIHNREKTKGSQPRKSKRLSEFALTTELSLTRSSQHVTLGLDTTGQLAPHDDIENAISTDQANTSSMSSLIPETPAPRLIKSRESQTYFDDDGKEVDMETTIIVDCSSLDDSRRHMIRSSGLQKKLSIYSRKRKHQEVAIDSSEVYDTQDSIVEPEGNKIFHRRK